MYDGQVVGVELVVFESFFGCFGVFQVVFYYQVVVEYDFVYCFVILGYWLYVLVVEYGNCFLYVVVYVLMVIVCCVQIDWQFVLFWMFGVDGGWVVGFSEVVDVGDVEIYLFGVFDDGGWGCCVGDQVIDLMGDVFFQCGWGVDYYVVYNWCVVYVVDFVFFDQVEDQCWINFVQINVGFGIGGQCLGEVLVVVMEYWQGL